MNIIVHALYVRLHTNCVKNKRYCRPTYEHVFKKCMDLTAYVFVYAYNYVLQKLWLSLG